MGQDRQVTEELRRLAEERFILIESGVVNVSSLLTTNDDAPTNLFRFAVNEDATVLRVKLTVLAVAEADQSATWECDYSFMRELASTTVRTVGAGSKDVHKDAGMTATDVTLSGDADSCINVDVTGLPASPPNPVQWSLHGIISSYKYVWE